jgi:DNA polymerase I
LQSARNIEKIKTSEYVYDIEVEDNHRFFANYVLVHNTDSIAFLQGEKSKKQVHELLDEINKKLPGIMELDLEGFYQRGIWVTKRTGDIGAKKKYALIDEKNNLRIRGFETVRRDWCTLARKTQNEILQLILREGNETKALEYLKKIIKKIKSREVPLTELLIKTQLKKSIEEYKSEGPHVTIAKKMREENLPVNIGMLIEYYIAEPKEKDKKRSLIRERAKLPTEKGTYDIDYYLKNQILPAVENIFEVFKVDVHQLIDGKKQMKLGEF